MIFKIYRYNISEMNFLKHDVKIHTVKKNIQKDVYDFLVDTIPDVHEIITHPQTILTICNQIEMRVKKGNKYKIDKLDIAVNVLKMIVPNITKEQLDFILQLVEYNIKNGLIKVEPYIKRLYYVIKRKIKNII